MRVDGISKKLSESWFMSYEWQTECSVLSDLGGSQSGSNKVM